VKESHCDSFYNNNIRYLYFSDLIISASSSFFQSGFVAVSFSTASLRTSVPQARTSSLRKNQRLSFQLERNGETEETTHRGQLNFVGRMESGSMANSFHTLSSGAAKRLQHSPHSDGGEKENNDVVSLPWVLLKDPELDEIFYMNEETGEVSFEFPTTPL
jgi:hypothetical protein